MAKVLKRETIVGKRAAAGMQSSVFSGNAATKHGKQMEAVACVQFSKKTAFSVTEVGSVVSEEMPWLSASPDSMIDSEMPFLRLNAHMRLTSQSSLGTASMTLGRDRTGHWSLYKMDQMAIKLLCTKKAPCFLYVWRAEKGVLIEVPFNPD